MSKVKTVFSSRKAPKTSIDMEAVRENDEIQEDTEGNMIDDGVGEVEEEEEDRIEREAIRIQNEKAREIEMLYLQEQREKKQEKVNNVMRRISGGLVLPCKDAAVTPPPTNIGRSSNNNVGYQNSGNKQDSRDGIEGFVIVIEKIFCVVDDCPQHSLFAQLLAIVAEKQRSLGSPLSSDMNLSHNMRGRHHFLSSCMYLNISSTSVTVSSATASSLSLDDEGIR